MEGENQVFKEIHGILDLANATVDTHLLRCRILDFLFNRIYAENSVFFIPDQNGKSTGGIEVNLDEKYVHQYKEYYHRYDPIQFIDKTHYTQRVIRVEDIIDYKAFMTSAFYCDFLKPQKIHHKLYITLTSGGTYHGRISLYRPANTRQFSREEVNALRMISPYLGHALDHHELYLKNKVRDIFLDILDENGSRGILLFDESMQFIYMNRAAREFCRTLAGGASLPGRGLRVPQVLTEDCRAMADELGRRVDDCLLLPRHRFLRVRPSQELSVSTRLLSKRHSSENERYFVVTLNQRHGSEWMDRKRLKEMYRLTDREIDITRHLFGGLKNAEIARKLNVCEITVKKHIQKIFQKVGANNRTAVVRKIFEDHRMM